MGKKLGQLVKRRSFLLSLSYKIRTIKPVSIGYRYEKANVLACAKYFSSRAGSFEMAKALIARKIIERGELPHVSLEKQLAFLDQFGEFDLGRFLIQHAGLNGYWTHYIVTHPVRREKGSNLYSKALTTLEDFMLNKVPVCLATQQRFHIFKKEIQKRIEGQIRFALVPCRLMAELLDLDYSACKSFSLYGFDLDAQTLLEAQNYASPKGMASHCFFELKDAWQMGYTEAFDLIASNGLTIYEPDDARVLSLYKFFFTALKRQGTLITSFLTPPPALGGHEWKIEAVNLEDALQQRIIMGDVLGVKWQSFRLEANERRLLLEAGFQSVQILYDQAHIFPTLVAVK